MLSNRRAAERPRDSGSSRIRCVHARQRVAFHRQPEFTGQVAESSVVVAALPARVLDAVCRGNTVRRLVQQRAQDGPRPARQALAADEQLR